MGVFDIKLRKGFAKKLAGKVTSSVGNFTVGT